MAFDSQKALYQALLRNDERAFEHLYLLLYQRVAQYIFESGGSRQQTKTVVHETIISFLFNLRHKRYVWREEAELTTYVVKIARHKWSQMQKDARRQRAMQLSSTTNASAENDPFDTNDSDSDEFDFEQRRLKAVDSLAELGSKCRQVLELYYIKGKSMAEIAEIVGWANENVAKKEKYRCLQRLRQKLNLR